MKPVSQLKHVTAAEVAHIRHAFHEAGHALCATILNGEIHCVTASAAGGRTEYEDHAIPDAIRAPIVFSGVYSEAFWAQGTGMRPSPGLLAAAWRSNGSDDAALGAMGRGARTSAEMIAVPLIEQNWPAVARLAAVLFKSGEVTHDDALAALGVASGDGLALARLRHRAGTPGWCVLPAPACYTRHCH